MASRAEDIRSHGAGLDDARVCGAEESGIASALIYRRHEVELGAASAVVRAATRAARGTWSAPHDLSAPGHDAHAPQVALDRAGDTLAVWARSNGTDVVV